MNFLYTTLQYLVTLPFRLLYKYKEIYWSFPFIITIGLLVYYVDPRATMFIVVIGAIMLMIHLTLITFSFIFSPIHRLKIFLEKYKVDKLSYVEAYLKKDLNDDFFDLYLQPKFLFLFSFNELLFINKFISDYDSYMSSDSLKSPDIEWDIERRKKVIKNVFNHKKQIYTGEPISEKYEYNLSEYEKELAKFSNIKKLKNVDIKNNILLKIKNVAGVDEFKKLLHRDDLSDKVQRNLIPLLEMINVMEKTYNGIDIKTLTPIFKNIVKTQQEYDDMDFKMNVKTVETYNKYFNKLFNE